MDNDIYTGKIVFLDAYTLNPGDLDWAELKQFPGLMTYERTLPADVVERIGDARIVITNKTVLTEKEFAQLTPECLWYPTAVPTDHPAAPYNIGKEFTHYTLTVHYDGGKTVLSQGEARQEKGKTIFTNRTALPGISLTIADYEKKELQVDSVKYEILYFKGHDFFSQYFTELQDTLPGVIRELKNDIELEWGRDYPFRKFVLAETPAQHYSYIRNWKGYTEYVMPEIVFVPERGILWSADIQSQIYRAEHWRRRDRGTQDPVEMKVEILRSYLMNRFVEDPKREHDEFRARLHWSNDERQTFVEVYRKNPKDFRKIADALPEKTHKDVIEFYYLNRYALCLKENEGMEEC